MFYRRERERERLVLAQARIQMLPMQNKLLLLLLFSMVFQESRLIYTSIVYLSTHWHIVVHESCTLTVPACRQPTFYLAFILTATCAIIYYYICKHYLPPIQYKYIIFETNSFQLLLLFLQFFLFLLLL